jgi:hypothetical protein
MKSTGEARQLAVPALKHPEPAFRGAALEFLIMGTSKLAYLRDDELHLNLYSDEGFQEMYRAMNPGQAAPPPDAARGLKAEDLRPLLKDGEPRFAAYAGYLLALLGEPEGLEPLVRHWREQRTDESWRRLVYTAVAALADDNRTNLLEEVYRTFGREDVQPVRQFYWAIRGMEGPNALRLRKLIRHEIGMENLR